MNISNDSGIHINFEQVTGNNRFRPWNVSDFSYLVDLSEYPYRFSRLYIEEGEVLWNTINKKLQMEVDMK